MAPKDGTGSFAGKPATVTDAAIVQPNTLVNPSQPNGGQNGDGQKMDSSPPAENTTRPNTSSGVRVRSLSGLLRAENVQHILYVGDFRTVKIEVTLDSGSKDSKVISVGDDEPPMAFAIIVFEDNFLGRGGRFYDLRPPRPIAE